MPEYGLIMQAADHIRSKTDFVPDAAVILGSGLGGLADAVEDALYFPFDEVPAICKSTAPGHKGRFVLGTINGTKVIMMQGRLHYNEGYSMADVVRPVRMMGMLGAKKLLITNASGGINWNFSVGDLMLITDHICNAPSPLIGENIAELGPRFPDMSEVYSKRMREIIKQEAIGQGIALREGVYIQVTGPQYETPAEIRMYRSWGADAVGMSSAAEAIAARHMGMEIAGISLISNLACGMTAQPLSHEEVEAAGRMAAGRFGSLLKGAIGKMAASH